MGIAARFVLLGVLLGGCSLDVGSEPEIDTSLRQPLKNGATQVVAQSPLAKSTVLVQREDPNDAKACTGVIVGLKWVLTAAHCVIPSALEFQKVGFYDGPYLTGDFKAVVSAQVPPGVTGGSQDTGQLNDTNGKFADIEILELESSIPNYARVAQLPLVYPGNDVSGWLVGVGAHDGDVAGWDADMRQLMRNTYSSNTNDGHFLVNDNHLLTEGADADEGDSGGPFLIYNSTTSRYVVQGVASQSVDEWLSWKTKYASITFRLNWVLDGIQYTGGMTRNINAGLNGASMSSFWLPGAQSRRCALYCESNPSCAGYAHNGTTCTLLSTISGSSIAFGTISGQKRS